MDESALRRATTAFVLLGLVLRVFRYLADFPLWCDESRLAANLIDVDDFGRLFGPLRYAQTSPAGFLAVETAAVRLLGFSTWSLRLVPLVCSLASVVLFRHLAGRVLGALPTLFAVAIFSVSWWPIGFAAEVKPYASDLLVSLVLLSLGVEWLRRPGATLWLWALAVVAVLAIPVSFPSVFVIGGVCLALAPSIWRTRRNDAWAAFLTLAVVPAATFAAILPLYEIRPDVRSYLDHYWAGGFPPIGEPIRLLLWIVEAHTGALFAYPMGHAYGGSVLTTVCFVAGVRALWVRGRRELVVLCLAPLALCFLAAVMHRYPYGYKPRTMQFFVPAVCLFAGEGLSTLIQWHANRRRQALRVKRILGVFLGVAAVIVVFTLVHPYKLRRDLQAREFANWFWENLSHDAELACARSDLGLIAEPRHWNGNWTDYYLCYQEIFSERHRQDQPLLVQRISKERPLKCVFFNEEPEDFPEYQLWMNNMKKTFIYRSTRKYTVRGRDPGAPDFVNTYFVVEFVPRHRRGVLQIPGIAVSTVNDPLNRR